LATSRELEEACVVMEPVLDGLMRIDSATIRTDVAGLTRTLNRWHAEPVVREILPRLTMVLRTDVAKAGR
jgi:hypothetical protein